jgi:hypothetical protein
LSSLCIYAQEPDNEKKIIPIEFTFSLNRTTVPFKEASGKFGFGAGVYLRFFNQERCHLITGIEYNRNRQLFESVSTPTNSCSEVYYDVIYSMNNIGIPVFLRVNIGKKVIFFTEAGAFFDFIIFSKEKKYKMPNFGPLVGIGLRIPIQKYEILLKVDYKWGIRNLDLAKQNHLHKNYIRNCYWRVSVGFKAPWGFNLSKK